MSSRNSRGRSPPDSPGERCLFYALLLFVVWLPLPLGSNRPWAAALLAGLAALLLAAYLVLQAIGHTRRPLRLGELYLPIALWLAWLGWCALQLLPLSFQSIETWSPAAAASYVQAFPVDAASQRWPLSIAPSETYHRLLLSCGLFALWLLVAGLARDRRRLRLLAEVLVISGLLQALYGGFMVLSGIEYVLFEPKTSYRGYATGTFINRNHLAGYLELCSAVGIGLVLADLGGRKGETWKEMLRNFTALLFSAKLRVRVFLAAMLIGLVLTRSRGGNLAFFTSLIGCGLIYVFVRERQLFLKSLLLFGSLLVVDILLVGEWYGLDKLIKRIEQTDVTTEVRAHVLPVFPPIIEDYWRTGAGLGSFATAFAPRQPENIEGYWDHAHNDYAEFLIEAGVPGCAILLALVLVTVLHAARVILRRTNRLRVGMCFAAIMAICQMAIHSFTDFNLQIPANAATLIILFGMAAACSPKSRRQRARRRPGAAYPDDAYPMPVS